ncbi:response regulator [Flavobacterium sp. 3HN19-14]|uniref:response regulator n=1 Tax=Flavobacterium sp. 3HN19-14 TaxID=3448133 RepID=UPI003EDE9636
MFTAILTKPVKQHLLCSGIQTSLSGAPSEPQQEKPQSMLSDAFAQTYPLRIMVAEDNKINQKFIEHILKKLGYSIDMVHNGMEVLNLMETNTYDVLLMDVQMPEMDGFEATSIIRSRPGYQPIIVAMTANALSDDKDLCIQNGMDDYLGKPMKIEEVMNLLVKLSNQLRSDNS